VSFSASSILRLLCSDEHALHSRLILGEGGYFDSQTTDTQFFGPSDPYPTVLHRDITPHSLHPAVKDGTGIEYSNMATASVIKLPITLAPETPATADIDSADRRSNGPKEKWDRLDELLNGPDYANGQLWTIFPVLKRHRPGVDHPAQSFKWMYDASREEIDMVDAFCFRFQALAGAQTPSNSIQGELIFITMFLTRIIPFMARTIMDSDLVKMRELVGAGRDLLQAMELLVDVEDGARERLNGDIEEEIAKLDGVNPHV
jgi:hypothetical protein